MMSDIDALFTGSRFVILNISLFTLLLRLGNVSDD
jgi:hypothetical protein